MDVKPAIRKLTLNLLKSRVIGNYDLNSVLTVTPNRISGYS